MDWGRKSGDKSKVFPRQLKSQPDRRLLACDPKQPRSVLQETEGGGHQPHDASNTRDESQEVRHQSDAWATHLVGHFQKRDNEKD
jgi:hypothetical protein